MYVCYMLLNKYSKNILEHHLDERMYTTYSPLPQTSAVQGDRVAEDGAAVS